MCAISGIGVFTQYKNKLVTRAATHDGTAPNIAQLKEVW